MDSISLEALTHSISLKSALLMKLLDEQDLSKAEDVADDIRMMIFNFRRLSDMLKTS